MNVCEKQQKHITESSGTAVKSVVAETFRGVCETEADSLKRNLLVVLVEGTVDILSFLPLSSWCFAVALNFQSLATPMDLNDGRFQDNGGCGYVLKPTVLMSSQGRFDPSRSQRRVRPIHLLLKVALQSTE